MREVVSYVWAQSKAACDPRTMWTFLKIGIPGEVRFPAMHGEKGGGGGVTTCGMEMSNSLSSIYRRPVRRQLLFKQPLVKLGFS